MDNTQTPDRIWVRYSPNGHGAYVSSCEPSDVDDLDVAFVHADIHAAVVAERDQLKAKLTELESVFDDIIQAAVIEISEPLDLTALEKNDG